MAQANIRVGDIENVSGEVIIAGGDIYKGFTAEQVSALLTQITSTFQVKKFDGRCPYKGLDVFEEEDAELFFGREKLVDELVERVKDSRTAFITGPSGSGKSSLVRAGLIPALKQEAIPKSDGWLYETIKPGRDPLEALASAFSRLKSPELGRYFRENFNQPDLLHECAESALSGQKDQRFVLFIDQFEEVFTQVGKDKAEPFLNLLTQAASVENGRVIILFAMRSDFVSNCAEYPKLNDLLNLQFIQIGAMQPDELVSAIAQPALRVGLRIDPDLVAQIINDMRGEPGVLPLMQFALKDLFDSQEAKGGVIALTLADYMQHGGIHKALERHADKAFSKLSESEQELARVVFSGLIEIGHGRQDTRRTALFDELIPANHKAEDLNSTVQKLADARLIITDEQAGVDTVMISHEKLIDAWPWLKKLINENRDVIALQNEIASDAKEWEEHKRDTSYLYSGARLATAREKMMTQKLMLSGLAQDFIEQSLALQNAERKAKETLRRRITFGLVSGIAIASVLAVFGFVQARLATTNANKAEENLYLAKTAQVDAQNKQILADNNAATASANEQETKKQAKIALARQLASQAQSISAGKNSNEMISVLLAIESMHLLPSVDAFQILQKKMFFRPVSVMHSPGPVVAVDFSPDGKYVVSGGCDHQLSWFFIIPCDKATAQVWETVTGKEIANMTHGDLIRSVDFSPDGKYVVSGSDDGTARVWEALTGKEIARTTHDNLVQSATFSPDGKYVVSAGGDGTARVWETTTGKEVACMQHNNWVNLVAFNPDGKYVVSSSYDGTARVWEAMTGKDIVSTKHDDWITSLAFSPDGKYVVSGSSDGMARIWEAMTGKEIGHMIHGTRVSSVAVSPDGKYVVSGSYDGTARIWETATGKEIARTDHEGRVTSVAFSSDGKYMISGGCDQGSRSRSDTSSDCGKGTLRIWEVATGNEIARMIQNDSVTTMAFTTDKKYVVSGSEDGTAQVWNIEFDYGFFHITNGGWLISVVFSPGGQYAAAAGYDNTYQIWDVTTGKKVLHTPIGNPINQVVFSPDGNYVALKNSDGMVRVLDMSTGKEISHAIDKGGGILRALSPNGRYAALADLTVVRIWETATGKEITRMKHDDTIQLLAFSPDGKYLVSESCISYSENYSCQEGFILVWEVTTGKKITRISHNDAINSLAFSPDGKYVVIGGCDQFDANFSCSQGTARVSEAMTGKEIAHVTNDYGITSVAFSSDGKYVVSAGCDQFYAEDPCSQGTARVWEAMTGKEIARGSPDNGLLSATFSPNGQYLLIAGKDGIVYRWLYQPRDLIEDGCNRVTRNLTRAEWGLYIGDILPYQAICDNLPIEPEATTTP